MHYTHLLCSEESTDFVHPETKDPAYTTSTGGLISSADLRVIHIVIIYVQMPDANIAGVLNCRIINSCVHLFPFTLLLSIMADDWMKPDDAPLLSTRTTIYIERFSHEWERL